MTDDSVPFWPECRNCGCRHFEQHGRLLYCRHCGRLAPKKTGIRCPNCREFMIVRRTKARDGEIYRERWCENCNRVYGTVERLD